MAGHSDTLEKLRRTVADVIGCSVEDVEESSDFFGLGGDSVGAMQLSIKAREMDFKALTIPAVYEHPVLSEMVSVCASGKNADESSKPSATENETSDAVQSSTGDIDPNATPKISKLPSVTTIVDHWKLVNACIKQTGLTSQDIEDIYPAFWVQKLVVALMFDIEIVVNTGTENDVMQAIEKLYDSEPMLRTRLFEHDGNTYQVVLRSKIKWIKDHGSLADFRICNKRDHFNMGGPLSRFTVLTEAGKTHVIWTDSHAHMDRFIKPAVIEKLAHYWSNPSAPIVPTPSVKQFVRWQNDASSREASFKFWEKQLEGLDHSEHIQPTERAGKQADIKLMEKYMNAPSSRLPSIAYSTICQVAWGLVLAKYSRAKDVVYPCANSGRLVPDMQLHDVIAPLFARVPFRLTMKDPGRGLKEYLVEVQQGIAEGFAYEHAGEETLTKHFGHGDFGHSLFNYSHQVRAPTFEFTKENRNRTKEVMKVVCSGFYGPHDIFRSYYFGVEPAEGDRKSLRCLYDNNLIPEEKIASMMEYFIEMVQRLTQSAPWTSMTVGDIWPEVSAEREKVTEKTTNTPDATPVTGLPQTLCNILPADTNELSVIVPEGKQQMSLTQAQLRHCIQDFRVQLAKLKLHTSSAIILAFGNSLEFIVSFLGVTWSRYIAAPVNPALKEQEVDFYAKDIDAKLVLLPKGGYEASSAAALSAKKNNITVAECYFEGADVVLDVKERSDETNGVNAVSTLEDAKEDDVALILHTSGTTGRPKAVPLTHKNLFTSSTNLCNTYALSLNDRTLLIMPLYHIHGIVASFLSPLNSGGTIILPPKLTPSFWNHFATHGASWYTATPTMHSLILAFDTPTPAPSPRFIRSCSSALSPQLFHRLEEKFKCPVLESYAMTEAAHLMASNPLPPATHHPGCVGLPQGVEMQIRSDTGEPLSVGAEGEVCIRGANVTAGYLNNESANKTAFFSDGFFRTGDQGKMDEQGYLTLTGRLKEFINKGGEKISPVELDNVLGEHEDVEEVVCFAMEDEMYGQDVGAAVRAKQGRDLDVGALRRWIKERVAAHKVPRKIWILDEIPKTATGKVQRKMVAEKVKDM